MRSWLLVFIAAILLRVSLAPFTGHPFDISVFEEAGRNVAYLRSPYDLQPTLGYPPLWAFWCGAAYVVSGLVAPRTAYFYIFLLKAPVIVADIAIAWLLIFSRTVHRSGSHHQQDFRSLRAAELFLFNPYVVIVGVVWGMIDNIVVLLIVLMAIALVQSKHAWAGLLLGLSIALKVYPILFVPVCFIYLIKKRRRIEEILLFIVAIDASVFAAVTFPFVILHWNIGDLLAVVGAQGARNPGGIAPIGILAYLPQVGVQNIGPFSVASLSGNIVLRLLWIPAIAVVFLFLYSQRKFLTTADFLDSLILTYLVYIILAPWVSEQNVETLIVLMLFAGIQKGYGLKHFRDYALGSIIVFVFAALDVPITSFFLPLFPMNSAPLAAFAAPILPWIVMAFTVYCLFAINSTIRNRPILGERK
jgi:hypothetical protein